MVWQPFHPFAVVVLVLHEAPMISQTYPRGLAQQMQVEKVREAEGILGNVVYGGVKGEQGMKTFRRSLFVVFNLWLANEFRISDDVLLTLIVKSQSARSPLRIVAVSTPISLRLSTFCYVNNANENDQTQKGDLSNLAQVKDIKKGDKITEEHIRSIRPGHGCHTKHYWDLLGKEATADVAYGEPMKLEYAGLQGA